VGSLALHSTTQLHPLNILNNCYTSSCHTVALLWNGLGPSGVNQQHLARGQPHPISETSFERSWAHSMPSAVDMGHQGVVGSISLERSLANSMPLAAEELGQSHATSSTSLERKWANLEWCCFGEILGHQGFELAQLLSRDALPMVSNWPNISPRRHC
jgi:hypothetical protein